MELHNTASGGHGGKDPPIVLRLLEGNPGASSTGGANLGMNPGTLAASRTDGRTASPGAARTAASRDLSQNDTRRLLHIQPVDGETVNIQGWT